MIGAGEGRLLIGGDSTRSGFCCVKRFSVISIYTTEGHSGGNGRHSVAGFRVGVRRPMERSLLQCLRDGLRRDVRGGARRLGTV